MHRSNNPENSPIIKKQYKVITIYGPYYPEEKKKRLINLRDYLKEHGYEETDLVSERPDDFFQFEFEEDTKELERSEYCLEKSDLNIFIYFFEGSLSGVQTELDYIIGKEKSNYFVCVEEKLDENGQRILAFSKLVEENLKRIGKRFISFDEGDDEALRDVVYQRIFDFFM
jgi:hypothetical protein